MSHAPLRPYQLDAVRATFAGWARGLRSVAFVLPTGDGKTRTFTAVLDEWLATNPGRRVLVVAHRIELIEQAAADIREYTDRSVGIVMATRNQAGAEVVVASVQTLASDRRRAMIRNVGLIIVDECHRSAARSYVSLLAYWPDAKVLGVTATFSRSDDLGLGLVFEDVVYHRTIADSIAGRGNGGVPSLVRPRGLRVTVEDLDLRRVRTLGKLGDYREGDLGRAIGDSLAPKRVAEAWLEHAAGRQGLLFAPTVESAGAFADALNAEGIPARLVHGGTTPGERSAALDAFRAGSVAVLCNCSVFTEGTNLPMASVCVVARPTKSSGLYIQMVGRALRLFCPEHGKRARVDCCPAAKRDGLVLDVVGVAAQHSLAARVELFGSAVAEVIERDEMPPDDDEPELPLDGPEVVDLGDDGTVTVTESSRGELVATPVDLFGASGMAWGLTPAGAWYVPAGDALIAVMPGQFGGADVVRVPTDVRVPPSVIELTVPNLAEAMAIGEAQSGVAKRRKWSPRSIAATDKQKHHARKWGVQFDENVGLGELSMLIDAAKAVKLIDQGLALRCPWITYG